MDGNSTQMNDRVYRRSAVPRRSGMASDGPPSGPRYLPCTPRRTDGRTARGTRPFSGRLPLPMPPAGPAAVCLTLLSVRNVEYGGSGADMVAESLASRFRFRREGLDVGCPGSSLLRFVLVFARQAPNERRRRLDVFLEGSWVDTLKDVAPRRPHRQSRSLWENVC